MLEYMIRLTNANSGEFCGYVGKGMDNQPYKTRGRAQKMANQLNAGYYCNNYKRLVASVESGYWRTNND